MLESSSFESFLPLTQGSGTDWRATRPKLRVVATVLADIANTVHLSSSELNDPCSPVFARSSQRVGAFKSPGLVSFRFMDALSDVLDLSRVSGALMASVRAGVPWGLDLPQIPGAAFHAITSGTAWLRAGDKAPLQLMPGDVVLLPTGAPHRLSSEPDGRCVPFDVSTKKRLMTPNGDLMLGASGAVTTFVCAAFNYDLEVGEPLMGLLPPMIHVPADPVAGRDVAAIIELLAMEVGARQPGSRAAAARLFDTLLIAAIRRWLDRQADAEAPSWLRGLHDPALARVLAALHERPAESWTVESLAQEVHMSRATLARRFAEVVGEPPLTYLARWRMHLAAQRLKYSTDTVETIAREVGYTSEYAFNRAFVRHRGQPPGRYRRLVRTA
jgi:AraC-like DNA-binding protein